MVGILILPSYSESDDSVRSAHDIPGINPDVADCFETFESFHVGQTRAETMSLIISMPDQIFLQELPLVASETEGVDETPVLELDDWVVACKAQENLGLWLRFSGDKIEYIAITAATSAKSDAK